MSQKEVGAGVGGQGGTREEAECWTAGLHGRPADWELLPALPLALAPAPSAVAAIATACLLPAFCQAAFLH